MSSNEWTELFLSHTWKKDSLGRDNHARVSAINTHLNQRGFRTWFDSDCMEGNIREKMADGVDFTKCVVVFVTQEYIKKIDSNNEDDNCFFEYQRAITQKTSKNMICVVMERELENTSKWTGILKETMGGSLFVSMSGDVNDACYLKKQTDDLLAQLALKDVFPSQTKKACPNCTVADQDNNRHPMFLDGMYCTHCSSVLKETKMPKSYCEACNIHDNGRYCKECRMDLMDESKKIDEMQEMYVEEVKLKTRTNIEKYPVIVTELQQVVLSVEAQLQSIKEARTEMVQNGTKMSMKEDEYTQSIGEITKIMEDLLTTSQKLPQKAELCVSMEPDFDRQLDQLIKGMDELQQYRKELKEESGNLLRTTDHCLEAQQNMEDLLENLTKYSLKEYDISDENHGRHCPCEECVFEQHMNSEMITNKVGFLTSLVVKSDLEKLQLALKLQSSILDVELKEGEDDHNLLVALTVKFGSAEMLNVLLDAGAEGDEINKRNETLLHLDIIDFEIVRILCEKYGQKLLTVRNLESLTPFMRAYCNENEQMMEALKPYIQDIETELFEGKLVKPSLDDGLEHLEQLVEDDDITTMKSLLDLRPNLVERRDGNGRSVLLIACRSGSVEMFMMLCDRGADMLVADCGGENILLQCVYNKKHRIAICRYILEKHPELVVKGNCNRTNIFLRAAFDDKRSDVIPIIFEYKPDPEMITKNNRNGINGLKKARERDAEKIIRLYEEYLEQNKPTS